jgi:hypothetical protein
MIAIGYKIISKTKQRYVEQNKKDDTGIYDCRNRYFAVQGTEKK